METLPNKVLELIFWQLSPRDLAHCSAVCRLWYEMINQDWIWVKHCDPELEEPLRTIPSVATPKFEIPIAKTLSPPSHWKIAFLREKHLWKNWRLTKILQFEKDTMLKYPRSNLLGMDFFSDTQVVVWYSNKIEILDISATPPVTAAQTDIPVSIESIEVNPAKVVGNNLLLVQNINSIKVFKVDIANKCITLKLNLSDILLRYKNFRLKANFFIFFNGLLGILDLTTGKTLKTEHSPLKEHENERASLGFIECSPTSDFVCLSFCVRHQVYDTVVHKIFLYSLRRLAYLPGPVITFHDSYHYVTLHDCWMVLSSTYLSDDWGYGSGLQLTIFHISQKDKVLIHDSISFSTPLEISVCNGWFVFKFLAHRTDTPTGLRAYSPSSKTLITIDFEEKDYFEIINNKVIAVFDRSRREHYSKSTWKLLSQTIEECDFSVVRGCKINQSFTKVVHWVNRIQFSDSEFEQYCHCWYVKHLW